ALKQVPPADDVVYYPLDYAPVVKQALRSAQPDVVLLMEWEIWPNFLNAAKRQGATVAVLNGRVSDKGLRRGQRARFFTAPGLAAVDLFAMQSEEDARRAALVGADPARVIAAGTTKFDESLTMLTAAERDALCADLGIPAGVPVLICGSTRDEADAGAPPEEAVIARAVSRLRERFPNLFLIVAPRHLERADAVAAILEESGMRVRRRSAREPLPPGGGVNTLLLDTFGELGRAYAVADVAFIGGSLVRRGGQSVFQPLAQGVPALFGPHMNNQRDIAALSAAEGVGFLVADEDAFVTEAARLLAMAPEEKEALARRARALIDRNQGVTARSLDAVEDAWRQRTGGGGR
ncbi:MAG TPA: glycosyltransferase N-terminal domain-containing protein, partial [Armatimonadaceae bacterium]|nr:glycosyltransferase N-terminal domain-containing protein [Armatimonadaceae bacterium]